MKETYLFLQAPSRNKSVAGLQVDVFHTHWICSCDCSQTYQSPKLQMTVLLKLNLSLVDFSKDGLGPHH